MKLISDKKLNELIFAYESHGSGNIYNALKELKERRATDKYSCDSIKKDENGKCPGYQKSDVDDEPAEKCMECTQNVFYEG